MIRPVFIGQTESLSVDVITISILSKVVDRFVAYGAAKPGWGSLHIAIADHNIDDEDLTFCIADAQEKLDWEGEVLARIMLEEMQELERLALIRMIGNRHE